MKHMKKLLALALVAMTVLAVAVPAMAAYSTMYVNVGVGQTVRLRSQPNSGDNVLINVPHGSAVEAERYNGTWHRVKYSGYTGYMMSSFLSTTNPADSGWISRYGAGVMNSANGTSTQVRNLQNDLIGLGFSVGPTGADGYYGPNTTEGIREFQRAYGLRVDGAAGPETKAKLYSVRIP